MPSVKWDFIRNNKVDMHLLATEKLYYAMTQHTNYMDPSTSIHKCSCIYDVSMMNGSFHDQISNK